MHKFLSNVSSKIPTGIKWWRAAGFLLILIAGNWIKFNLRKWDGAKIIIWDVMLYYHYLPAVFVYHDLAELKFSDLTSNAYKPTGDLTRFGIMDHTHNGKSNIKYPIDVAVMNIPFFFSGHLAAKRINGKHPTDGFSIPYQMAIAIGNFLYVYIGLFFLFGFLRKYVNELASILTILVVIFGTNLYHYAIFEPGMSHSYLFFLYAAGLLLTHHWYKSPNLTESVVLGSVMGLIVITRPTDIFFVFFLIMGYCLWMVTKWILSKDMQLK